MRSDKRIGFILSDDPVVRVNQFAECHPKFRRYEGITGLAAKGLQIFLPLSATVCCVLYDANTYRCGGDQRVCRLGIQDIRTLNILQARHAFECVYFLPRLTPHDEIPGLLRAWAERPPMAPLKRTERVFIDGDPDVHELLRFITPSLRVGRQFTFMETTDRDPYSYYDRVIVPVRSPTVLRETEQMALELERLVLARRTELEQQKNASGDDSAAAQQAAAADGASPRS